MEGAEDFYVTMSNTSYGPSTLPKRPPRQSAMRDINSVKDIDGAQPKGVFIYDKPNFTYSNLDINGSTPKTLHPFKPNRPDNSLNVSDIPGAQFCIKDKMLTTKRHVNNMDPVYPLPSFKMAEPYVPKFIRDSYNVSDIEGTKSRIRPEYESRDFYTTQDIEGAQANWRPVHQRVRLEAPPIDTMDVQDISKRTHRYIDRTTRETNVLDPKYDIYGFTVADDPRFSKPKKLKEFIPDNKLLRTDDIMGATNAPSGRPRTEVRNINNTLDIPGAQADTIKHSITTMRMTNPLNPVYQSLDPGEVLVGPIAPLLPAELNKKPTLKIGFSTAAPQSHGSVPNKETSSTSHNNYNSSSSSARRPSKGQQDDDGRMYSMLDETPEFVPPQQIPSSVSKLILPKSNSSPRYDDGSSGRLSATLGNQNNSGRSKFAQAASESLGDTGRKSFGVLPQTSSRGTLPLSSGRQSKSDISSGRKQENSVEKRVRMEREEEINLVRQL